jgi:hypothetical protein
VWRWHAFGGEIAIPKLQFAANALPPSFDEYAQIFALLAEAAFVMRSQGGISFR